MEYPARVRSTGGRRGRVWNETKSLDSVVVPPGSSAAGVTPEEFLGAAWSSCYGSAYAAAAREAGVSADVEFQADVVLSVTDNDYTVSRATLTVIARDQDPLTVQDLAAQAHARCPISKLLESGVHEVSINVTS